MDQLTNLSATPIYLIIFTGLITGLIGSGHCVGMCGGLVMAATTDKKSILSYHLGRLMGYTLIGAILPAIGLTTLGLENNKTVATIGAISMGIIFIYIGLKSIFNWKGTVFKHQYLEKLNSQIWKILFSKFKNLNTLRAFLGGTSSAFLPCGLLWSILIISISATNFLLSLTFIISFWLGTMPALSFAPSIIKKILLPLKNKLPRALPTSLILVGITTITYRLYFLYQIQSCH